MVGVGAADVVDVHHDALLWCNLENRDSILSKSIYKCVQTARVSERFFY